MKIAVLTGGGHVSSLNAGIEGITKEATKNGWEILGVTDSWEGIEKGNFVKLTEKNTKGIKKYGGSILGSGRWKPDIETIAETVEKENIDGIIALGGDDTLGVLDEIRQTYEIPSVGWPKTMDNDLGATYFSLGYPTAVHYAAETVNNSFEVAWSHGRIAMVSVFGRSTDWVAAGAAAYGDADMIVPGEETTDIENIYEKAKEAYFSNEEDLGKPYATMVVAEGASIGGLETHVKDSELHTDGFGHPKLDPNDLISTLSDSIRRRSKEEFGKQIKTAPMSLTYQLRNGKPLKIDRKFGFKCGRKCIELLEKDEPGKMAIIERKGDRLEVGKAPLSEGAKVSKVKDIDYIDYDEFEVTDSYLEYAKPFLGERNEREIHLIDRS